jgi:hypothetical protein
MSHPFAAHRQSAKEHSRVVHITRGYKSGGAVKGEKTIGKKALNLHKAEHAALHAEGGKSKHRMDRPHRAKGGKVKGKSGKTIVNVITGHPAGGVAPPPMAPPMGLGAAAAPPAAPPVAARPPMPMGPPPGAGMPGQMPMRAKGGRIKKAEGGSMSSDEAMKRIASATSSDSVKRMQSDAAMKRIESAVQQPMQPMRARGGKVKTGPTWNEGLKSGTQVQHDTGKNDLKDMNRGRQVTFWAGGKVKKHRAEGGRVESPDGVAKATRLPGGSGGGEARLAKEHRAERR